MIFTFPLCSQILIMLYHSLIHSLGFFLLDNELKLTCHRALSSLCQESNCDVSMVQTFLRTQSKA